MKRLDEIFKFLSGIPTMMGRLNMPNEKVDIVQDVRKIIYEWKSYKDLEEQGKLLKLPCAVGDLVYEPYQFMGDGAWEIDIHKIRIEDLKNIGKTVFLTEEEARDALEELRRTE